MPTTTTAPRYALNVRLVENNKSYTMTAGDRWRNEELCLAAGYNWLNSFGDNHSSITAEEITKAFLTLRQTGLCQLSTRRRGRKVTLIIQVAVMGEE